MLNHLSFLCGQVSTALAAACCSMQAVALSLCFISRVWVLLQLQSPNTTLSLSLPIVCLIVHTQWCNLSLHVQLMLRSQLNCIVSPVKHFGWLSRMPVTSIGLYSACQQLACYCKCCLVRCVWAALICRLHPAALCALRQASCLMQQGAVVLSSSHCNMFSCLHLHWHSNILFLCNCVTHLCTHLHMAFK
jgi:hypothetical protein